MKFLGNVFFLFIILFGFSQAFAYELTEKDNNFLDIFEERLFSIIDERDSVTAERVEGLLEEVLEKNLKDRTRTLVEVILADLQYEYSIGEYAGYTQTADECYDDEYFDEEDGQCYFNDEDYSYEDEEDFIEGDYREESDFDYSDDGSTDNEQSSENEGGEETILATYSISGDDIMIMTGTTSTKAENAWKTFATIIPASSRTDFKLYNVFDDENGDTAALVEQDADDYMKWNLTINIAAVYEGGDTITSEGIATLIHEFTHVMTLNKTQMRYLPQTQDEGIIQRFEENCTTNFVQEGCLNETAYLDDFIDTFWTDEAVLKQAQLEGVSAYSDTTADNFITDYAGTNPGEDIAESFTYFVLNVKPTGDKISDKKLNFFYNYKELESLRKQIRSKIEALSK